jgi:hypothetical protein
MRRAGQVLALAGAVLLGLGLAVYALAPNARPGLACLVDLTKQPVQPDPAAPLAEPRFSVQIPADFQWAEQDTRDLLLRCWRALRDFYGVAPPYPWRVVYGPAGGPGQYDLPALPLYDGQGRLRLSVDYLAAPPGDDRWAQADSLGTLEGLAYAFHEYLGLDHTDLSEGLAAYTARNLGPALWGGLRAGEMNVLILGFEEQEHWTVDYWRRQGRLPPGTDQRTFDRRRGIAFWRQVDARFSGERWRRFSAELSGPDRRLAAVADHRQGNRLVLEALNHVAGQDCGTLFRQYGYDL